MHTGGEGDMTQDPKAIFFGLWSLSFFNFIIYHHVITRSVRFQQYDIAFSKKNNNTNNNIIIFLLFCIYLGAF